MQVSKEKAIATFTYPYQSYGISFALDEINYEELYRVFIDYCTYFDGFTFSALTPNTTFADFAENKETVRSQIDLIFNEVLVLDTDAEGFYKYGTVKSERGLTVNVCFSKVSDTEPRVVDCGSHVSPLIVFKFELSFLGEKRPESCFMMIVTKEKDLKQGLPDWR